MPPEGFQIGTTDQQILALLAENARRSLADIGARVSLSPAAVKRRIERLEQAGVIQGYTVVIDEASRGRPMQAFTELRFAGTTRVGDIGTVGREIDEVRAVYTIAGDPDALLWISVTDVQHLSRTIDQLRQNHHVRGTKTLIVLDSWHRAASSGMPRAPGLPTERRRGSRRAGRRGDRS